jgi:hypothetical protein
MEGIVNKVADSGIITLDLEIFYPKNEVVELDLKNFLFMEMILKEKDFREQLDKINWQDYKDKLVAVFCSVDAVIPMWAYMLISAKLSPYTNDIYFGNKSEAIEKTIEKNIDSISTDEYKDKRVVVKGCGDLEIPSAAFLMIANKLVPVAKSLMYGEPCSTVPVFKKK